MEFRTIRIARESQRPLKRGGLLAAAEHEHELVTVREQVRGGRGDVTELVGASRVEQLPAQLDDDAHGLRANCPRPRGTTARRARE